MERLSVDDDDAHGIDEVPFPAFAIDIFGTIRDVNRAALERLGAPREHFVARPIGEIVAGLSLTEVFTRRIGTFTVLHDVRVQDRHGELTADLLLERRDSHTAIAMLLPPTAAAVRREDLAHIVHDLKNPLSTIQLETCLLDELADGNPSSVRAGLDRISRNLEYIDRIVHELLDLDHLDSGNLTLLRARVDVGLLLERTIDRVVPSRDRARVRLDAPMTLAITCDELRIERVVANLVHNALVHAPGGSIVVRLERIEDRCVVSVIDSGPGLAPDQLARVFDKYWRANTSRSAGSGLGLHVSRRIVEAHGGFIRALRVPGGSCFEFELPIAA